MTTTLSSDLGTITRYFGAIAEMTSAELSVLERSLGAPRSHSPGTRLTVPGQLADRPRVIVSGWAFVAVGFADGRRQIVDFRVPGDLIGFCSRPGARTHTSCFSLTSLVTAAAQNFVTMAREQPLEYPGMARALLAIEEKQEMRRIMHIVRLGRQAARERMAAIILDLYHRLAACGLQKDGAFAMPATQEVLGDALGLSTVHVNRTLQELRRENLIRTVHGQMEILNIEALSAVAGVDSCESI